MNKKLLWVVIAIGIAISAAIGYLLLSKPETPAASEQTAQTAEQAAPETQSSAAPGAYKDYTNTSIETTSGTKVLFFHAPWCPQCRQLDTEIKAGNLPSGVTIFKVDYDTNQVLRQRYGVSLQTTFVKVDDQGNMTKKYVAYDNPTLTALTQSGLW